MQTSTRFAVSYPVAARTDPADVALHIGNVVTGLEKAVRHDSGTFAARPVSSVGTPGIIGRIYYGTDDGQTYYDYGTGWITINTSNSFLLKTTNTNAASPSYQTFVGAEAYPRLQVNAGGILAWGSGSVAGDTTLYRSGADTLKTDDAFIAAGDISVMGLTADVQPQIKLTRNFYGAGLPGLQLGPGGSSAVDTYFYRAGVGILKTDGQFQSAGNISMFLAAADAQPQIQLARSGVGTPLLYFGPGGSTVLDTYLYRPSAGQLQVNGSFVAGSSIRVDFAGAAYKLYFGATDTVANLYRNAAGELRTDGTLRIGVSNVASNNGMYGPANMDFRSTNDVFITTDTAAGTVSLRDLTGNQMSFKAGLINIQATSGLPKIQFQSDVVANLYRSAAGVVKTDASLVSAQQVHSFHTLAGSILLTTDTGVGTGKPYIWFGSALDTNLYRNLAGQLKTDASFSSTQLSANPVGAGVGYGFVWAPAVYNAQSRMFTAVRVLGDAQPNFVIDADGKLNWAAGGSAGIDVTFGRSRASVLTLIGTLALGGVSGGGDGTKGIVFDNATTLPGVIDNNGGILFVQNGILYFRAGGNIRTVNLT